MRSLDPGVVLPPLREDLRIERGAPLIDGAPSWVIYDPVRHRYFQIGQRVVTLLSAWGAGKVGALRDSLRRERVGAADDREIAGLMRFLVTNSLTAPAENGAAGALAERAEAGEKGALAWLTHRYLFFRIPLVRPQRFLQATWPFLRPFFTRAMTWALVAMAAVGLFLVSRQWDAFIGYAERFLSPEGALVYILVLVVVKSLHELGHAYQAHARGLRVPVMGVAFLVMFPVLYTDVSDAWRLRRRRDRLIVDAGGVLVELSLAVIATLFWVFLPDGAMRSAAFVVATASWVLSLFVNLNPFLRFDGYYFLSDMTGLQNLQPRSFEMARWRLREILFGLGDPAPEPLPAATQRFMILYAWATWIYRVILFIGIALLVYTLFFKALGVLLFVIEIAYFLLFPIGRELMVWAKMSGRILRSPRAWVTGALFAGLVVLFLFPFEQRIWAPAILDRAERSTVFATEPGRLAEVAVAPGDAVTQGQVLYRLDDVQLEIEERQALMRISLLQLRLQRVTADAQDRSRNLVIQRELGVERARVSALAARRWRLSVTAPIGGTLVDQDPDLRPGMYISANDQLALIAAPGGQEIRGYMHEDDVARIDAAAEAVFVPEDPDLPTVPAHLADVSGFAIARMDLPELSTLHGGDVPVETTDPDGLTPFGAWFAVRANVQTTATEIPGRVRGTLLITGKSESLATRVFRQVARVLIREASF